MIITLATVGVCGWISAGYPIVESSAEALGPTGAHTPAVVSFSCEGKIGKICRGTLVPLLFAGSQSNTKR